MECESRVRAHFWHRWSEKSDTASVAMLQLWKRQRCTCSSCACRISVRRRSDGSSRSVGRYATHTSTQSLNNTKSYITLHNTVQYNGTSTEYAHSECAAGVWSARPRRRPPIWRRGAARHSSDTPTNCTERTAALYILYCTFAGHVGTVDTLYITQYSKQ